MPFPTQLTVPHVIITHVVSEPIPTSRRMSEPDKCIPSTIKSAPIRNDEASLDEKLDAMIARGVTNIEYVSDNESLAAALQPKMEIIAEPFLVFSTWEEWVACWAPIAWKKMNRHNIKNASRMRLLLR